MCQIGGFVDLDSREPVECGRGQIIMVPDAQNGGVRSESGENWVMDCRHVQPPSVNNRCIAISEETSLFQAGFRIFRNQNMAKTKVLVEKALKYQRFCVID